MIALLSGDGMAGHRCLRKGGVVARATTPKVAGDAGVNRAPRGSRRLAFAVGSFGHGSHAERRRQDASACEPFIDGNRKLGALHLLAVLNGTFGSSPTRARSASASSPISR